MSVGGRREEDPGVAMICHPNDKVQTSRQTGEGWTNSQGMSSPLLSSFLKIMIKCV